ncbi:glycosyltransferase family 21 protein [Durotheca rogersii]|uniref:glycosyltransferase family 21 protein n=1 Tax=Durotheca rogersii TaxID=419775 RepID=UPI00221FC8B3|nr:glycosyltransferase family 21 protein [Durotheca rogersii]KAI5857468.1 glycosyltransferase family 21 protein [Durotheca rogersii]
MAMVSTIFEVLGYVGLVWGAVVLVVQGIGSYKIFRYYSSVPAQPVSPSLPKDEVPHVTIIRPAKGLEPGLYECLASVFHQSYPKDKLTIYFCVSSKEDAAYPVILKLLDDHTDFDAKVFVEAEDPYLHGDSGHADNLGPNPKIRNLSRAYREAKGDIIWPLDCNVWVARDVAGRMVDKLCGYRPDGQRAKPFKFVHQLPLVVDTVSSMSSLNSEGQTLLSGSSITGGSDAESNVYVSSSLHSRSWAHGGGRLEEMFMATTHAKFYGAINTVGIAPCIVGKSNMFRKSHLDQVTDPARNPILTGKAAALPKGLDYFSMFMCEDHVIGDLLWRSDLPGYANHGLVWGDLAIQPMAGMSIPAYVSRRVRWLRARKWTVLSATLVEHGVESLVCCFYLSFSLTSVPWFHETLGIPQTWRALWFCWVTGVVLWMLVDRAVFKKLHAGQSMYLDEHTPSFARGAGRGGAEKRPFGEWILAWLGREVLALPIWTWAVFLGTSVNWRGKRFRVRSDMMVVAVDDPPEDESTEALLQNGRGSIDNGVSTTTRGKVD